MPVRTTGTIQHAGRLRSSAFWTTTLIIVFELTAGSVWNLMRIEWIEIQFAHLGYPQYLAYILGSWHVAAAVVLIAPGLPLLKEWAYAGAFILWSGAVASHLATGDGIESWAVPLVFAGCAVASWLLRPADRRLPETRLHPDRAAEPGQVGEARPRGWVVPLVLLALMYAISFATLPGIEPVLHDRAVGLGWIKE